MDKNQIVDKLAAKIERLGLSQSAAARQIEVSPATVSNILKGKWESITGAWQKVELWLGNDLSSWATAQTANFKRIQNLCAHAKVAQIPKAISFDAGSGKTYGVKDFVNNHANSFYVCAYGDMSKRQFLKHICKAMGLTQSTASEMLESIIDYLNSLRQPLLVIDEADELDDKALRIFKDIYNRCEVGIVLVGGRHLEKRIMKGVRNSKQSMQEIYSRLGGEFHKLHLNDKSAITLICHENAIKEPKQVSSIIQKSHGDLRRVKSLVNEIKLNRIAKQSKAK